MHIEVWLDGVQKLSYDDSSANRVLTGWAGMHNQTANQKYNWFTIDAAVGTPAGALPFVDDFTRADNVSLGTTWMTYYGNFSTDGSRGNAVGTADNWARPVTLLGTDNYSVTANLSIPTGGSPKGGVAARSNDATYIHKNVYQARLTSTGVELTRTNSYSVTTLQTASATVVRDTIYPLKLVVTGSNPVHLEVWLSGVKKIDYNDSSASRLTTGVPAIVTTPSSAGVKWDSFRVDAL